MEAVVSMEWLASSPRLRRWLMVIIISMCLNTLKGYLCLASHVKLWKLWFIGSDIDWRNLGLLTDICWGKLHLKFALFFSGHYGDNNLSNCISPLPQQIFEASLQRLAWRRVSSQCWLRPKRGSYNNVFPALFRLCCSHLGRWGSRTRPAWPKHGGSKYINFPGASRPLLVRKTRKWVWLRSQGPIPGNTKMLGMHPEMSKFTTSVPIILLMKLPPGDPHNLIPGWINATWSLEMQVIKTTHTKIRIRATRKGIHISWKGGFPRGERRFHRSGGRIHRSGRGQG